jgi:hypothetical protein
MRRIHLCISTMSAPAVAICWDGSIRVAHWETIICIAGMTVTPLAPWRS